VFALTCFAAIPRGRKTHAARIRHRRYPAPLYATGACARRSCFPFCSASGGHAAAGSSHRCNPCPIPYREEYARFFPSSAAYLLSGKRNAQEPRGKDKMMTSYQSPFEGMPLTEEFSTASGAQAYKITVKALTPRRAYLAD